MAEIYGGVLEMKILHICLCGPVTDNWNYQDNLLTKYHKKLGHDVIIITSKWVWNELGALVTTEKTDYTNDDGVRVIRLPLKGSADFYKKFKKYENLYENIKMIEPEIIFVHGCQFLDIKYISKYAILNPKVKIFVDNHADFTNSASNWLSREVLHKIIWRNCAKMIEPHTTKFYGVLPARVDFLIDIYKIPEEKVELLVMGADDEKVIEAKSLDNRTEIREKYDISPEDFLIMTGGKIDNNKKQTLLLMEAVKQLKRDNVKLIVFGSVTEELKNDLEKLCDGKQVQHIGWVTADDSYNYFSSADLVVFPGKHSVFWEQVVGLGIPSIFNFLNGATHVDVGGNCRFLYDDSVEEISTVMQNIIENPQILKDMKHIAEVNGMKSFSYLEIAKRSISY